MLESRDNDESILNSDTGISSDSAHSLTLVFFFQLFFEISKTNPYLYFFFFVNVIAIKMYIFKIVNLLYDVR